MMVKGKLTSTLAKVERGECLISGLASTDITIRVHHDPIDAESEYLSIEMYSDIKKMLGHIVEFSIVSQSEC